MVILVGYREIVQVQMPIDDHLTQVLTTQVLSAMNSLTFDIALMYIMLHIILSPTCFTKTEYRFNTLGLSLVLLNQLLDD